MPSRERPESVQIFGKTIFSRRGKLRRESGEFGSSSSSLHSAEMPLEAAPKEQHLLSLARRKLSRQEDPEPKKKLQISGPYDFQHLTHTEKDRVPEINRPDQMPQGRRPTFPSLDAYTHPGTVHGLLPQQDPASGLRSQSVSFDHEQARAMRGPPLVPRRSMKRAQSQDQIRVPPPRPPRSPIQGSFPPPVAPPPRGSSRGSVVPDLCAQLGTIDLDRPIYSSGASRPTHFVAMPVTEEDASEQATDEAIVPEEPLVSGHRFSHAITTPDNAAWPLVAESVVPSLPDVPEEEETHVHSRSRVSIASNSSSLRGSISVPLLRQITQAAPAIARPPSNASETLGRFDLFAAQRALQSNSDVDSFYDEPLRESWEDDIDYVYDHAAEADCDYAWERPSLDLERDAEDQDAQEFESTGVRYPSHGSSSSGMLSPPGQDDVPALSPVSQISNTTQNEIRTPTVVAPVTSNFSRPRRESSAQLVRGHEHTTSNAESFQELHGFDVFPSSLIPNDHHHQILLRERGELREDDEDYLVAPLSPSGTHFAKSALTLQARSSASTTDSMLSERSGISSRHRSAASTSTTLTHWTTSSTLGAIDSCEEKEHAATSDSEKDAVTALPQFDESRFPRERSRESHSRTQSHADLLFTKPSSDGAASVPSQEFIKTRRRAKTTSRSHNPPPVAFGLFPSTSKGNLI